MGHNIKFMTWFNVGFFIFLVFIHFSSQTSISNNVYGKVQSSDQTGCSNSIGFCVKNKRKPILMCAIEQVLDSLDCAIASNATLQLNDFIALKKNPDFEAVEFEARSDSESVVASIANKISNLLASRSIQFSFPQNESVEGRGKTGFSDLTGLNSFGGSGKKKSEHKIYSTFLFFLYQYFKS